MESGQLGNRVDNIKPSMHTLEVGSWSGMREHGGVEMGLKQSEGKE